MMRGSATVLALLCCFSAADARKTVPADARVSVVPFTQAIAGGQSRPIVTAFFNDHPMKMMIHSSASFIAQLRHHQARTFGVSDLRRVGSFGIDRSGHVSDAGFNRGVANTLRVGRTVARDAHINVFEVPQDDYGMLGVAWIRANRLLVDYVQNRATLNEPGNRAAARHRRLAAQGYVAVPMTYDRDEDRYIVTATVGNAVGRMIVATASSTSIEPAFARMTQLSLGKVVGEGSGPTGTAVPRYALSYPIVFEFGRFSAKPVADAVAEDSYAYLAKGRPVDQSRATAGYLGSDFLTQNHAIVDFGAGKLFLRS